MTLLSFSIASWNTKDLTRQTLKTLYENTRMKNFEVIVIDNGSKDGSPEMIEQEFPRVKLIKNKFNEGYGVPNNKVFRASSGKYFCLLNSDVIVLPGVFDRMIDFMESHPEYSVVTGKLLNPDGTLQESISFFPTLIYEFISRVPFVHYFYDIHKPFNHDKEQDIETFNGACYIVKSEDFKRVGMFDENLFAYMEETDLFFRMKQLKMKMRYLPDAQIIHYGGASTKVWADKHIMYYTNLLQFFKKEYGNGALVWMRFMVSLSNLISISKYPVIKLLPESEAKRLELREMDLALKLLKINLTSKIEI